MAEMRRTTIRMPEHFHAQVEREAAESGLSVAGLVREAVLARIMWGRAVRGESVFAVAAELAVAMRPAHQEAPVDAAAISKTARGLAAVAPDELDALLRKLDEVDPERAAFVRGLTYAMA